MKNKSNKEIVNVFHKYIPQTKDLANFIMNILDISKESVYRRLRSEVSFTFDEICTIARHLELSLDELAGLKENNLAVFSMSLYKATSPEDIYVEILQSNIEFLTKLRNAKQSNIISALNRFPLGITLYFKTIAKFYYFRWLYHIQNGKLSINFNDFVLPQRISDAFALYTHESENIPNSQMDIIVDENIFLYMIREIDYFNKRGLIKDSDLIEFKKELLEITDLTENINKQGVTEAGSVFRFYLSSIDIEPSYTYMKYDNTACVQYWSPASELIISYDPELCKRKLEWIESLKRYTTLITQCNDIQHIEYLKRQRHLVENMITH